MKVKHLSEILVTEDADVIEIKDDDQVIIKIFSPPDQSDRAKYSSYNDRILTEEKVYEGDLRNSPKYLLESEFRLISYDVENIEDYGCGLGRLFYVSIRVEEPKPKLYLSTLLKVLGRSMVLIRISNSDKEDILSYADDSTIWDTYGDFLVEKTRPAYNGIVPLLCISITNKTE